MTVPFSPDSPTVMWAPMPADFPASLDMRGSSRPTLKRVDSNTLIACATHCLICNLLNSPHEWLQRWRTVTCPEWNRAITVGFHWLPSSLEDSFQRSFLSRRISNISGCQNPKYLKIVEDSFGPRKGDRNWDFFFLKWEEITTTNIDNRIFDLGTSQEEIESCSILSSCLWPHGLYSPWNSLGQNIEVGSLSLLQGIFPTQGSNPGLLHCRQILYQLSH